MKDYKKRTKKEINELKLITEKRNKPIKEEISLLKLHLIPFTKIEKNLIQQRQALNIELAEIRKKKRDIKSQIDKLKLSMGDLYL